MSLATASENLLRSGVLHHVVIANSSNADKFAEQVIQRFVKGDEASVDSNTYSAKFALYDAVINVVSKFDGKTSYYKRLADALEAEMEKAKRKLNNANFYASAIKNSTYKTTDIVCSVQVDRSEVARFTIEGRVHSAGLNASAIVETASKIRDNTLAHFKQLQQVAGNSDKVKAAARNFYDALDALAKELQQDKSGLLHEFNRLYIQ